MFAEFNGLIMSTNTSITENSYRVWRTTLYTQDKKLLTQNQEVTVFNSLHCISTSIEHPIKL